MAEPMSAKERIIDSLRRSKNARTYADLGKSLDMPPEEIERLVLDLGRERKVRIHEPSARARVAKVEIYKDRITARMLAVATAPAHEADAAAAAAAGAAGPADAPPAGNLEARLARAESELASLSRRFDSELKDVRRSLAAMADALSNQARALPPRADATADLAYPGFREKCFELYDQLDAEGQYGGRVPIPALRTAMADRYSTAEFDRYVLQMARESAVDLQTLPNPYALTEAERKGAIENPAQGLLFYMLRRGR
ncbi:MAG: hypothetical protein HYZ53_01690 [Planctomycetes bacterium]|nr:hypothetical protein [Planctomycetota bacterium]